MHFRRRVPQASEKGTTKPTRCADVVVVLLITSKSRDVLNVAIPLNACVTVSLSPLKTCTSIMFFLVYYSQLVG